jgi:hypothetical protein
MNRYHEERPQQALGYLSLPDPDAPARAGSALSVKLGSIALVDYDFAAAGARRQALGAKFEAEIAPQPR